MIRGKNIARNLFYKTLTPYHFVIYYNVNFISSPPEIIYRNLQVPVD